MKQLHPEEYYRLGCDAVLIGRSSQTLRRNILLVENFTAFSNERVACGGNTSPPPKHR
jgi:hypothetical protein